MSTHITIETTVREIILVEEDVTEEEAKELRPDAIREMGPVVGKAEIESVVTAAHIIVLNKATYVIDEADAMSQAGTIPSQLDSARFNTRSYVDDEGD